MINNYPDNSLKLQTIKELEDKLIDVSGYIGNLGNSNNTETAKVISLALIALKIWRRKHENDTRRNEKSWV